MISVPLALLLVWLIAPPVGGAVDGGVQIYLQPLPSQMTKLAITVGSVTAVTPGGVEFPLTIHLKTAGPPENGRQRLLADGRLPFGRYVGFQITVTRAVLKNDRGDIPLVVPDAPARVDAPFVVTAQQTPLLWMSVDSARSIMDSSQFSPAFAATIAPQPIADHSGFVTNAGSNTITVFDKMLGQAVAVIDTCAGPSGMALDQRRRRVYVACVKDDEIQAIDVAAGQIAERVRVTPGDQPREIVLTPDGSTLISVNSGSNSISFFDASSLTRQEHVSVGSDPSSVLMDPAGRRAFVFNRQSSSISVIDVASRRLTATMSTDAAPVRGQFNANGSRLYVVHERSPYLTVFDASQLNVVTRARLGAPASAIAVDTVRGLICIGSASNAAVELYDPNALMPLFSMRTSVGVSHLVIAPQDNRVYLVNPARKRLSIGNLADRKTVSEIDIGDGAYWVAVMGER